MKVKAHRVKAAPTTGNIRLQLVTMFTEQLLVRFELMSDVFLALTWQRKSTSR